MEEEPDNFCEFNERPFSPEGSAFFHPTSIFNDARSALAYLPSAHETHSADGGNAADETAVGRGKFAYLVGRER